MLDERAELAERPVIFRDQEQRVVSEPARRRGARGSAVRGRAFGFEPDRPRGIGQGQAHRNAAPRRSSSEVGDGGQQLAVVGLVVAGFAGITRREHARGHRRARPPPARNRRRRPRCPAPWRHLGRLLAGVAGERIGILDDLRVPGGIRPASGSPAARAGDSAPTSGAISSAISRHFFGLRDARTSRIGGIGRHGFRRESLPEPQR